MIIFDEATQKYSVLEFKWLCKENIISIPGNNNFLIKKRVGATKNKLFDCYLDISKLEHVNIGSTFENNINYFILLTNHDEILNSNNKQWPLPKNGTIKSGIYSIIKKKHGKEKRISFKIERDYINLQYKEYYQQYVYLCLEVKPVNNKNK